MVAVLRFEEAIIHQRQENAVCRRQSGQIQTVARKADRGLAGICSCQEASLRSDISVEIYSGKRTGSVKRRRMSMDWDVT